VWTFTDVNLIIVGTAGADPVDSAGSTHYHFGKASFTNCQFGTNNAMPPADDVGVDDVDCDDSCSADTEFTVRVE